MSVLLVIDEAWARIDPAKAKADGYSGVIGYLSSDPSKNMNRATADAWHALNLSVGFVWETTANRSAGGSRAGSYDVDQAEKQATAIGVPRAVCLYYATDFAATPAQVDPYYAAVGSAASFRTGVYGSRTVVDSMARNRVHYGWQTSAWSSGISDKADIYQRVSHTRPPIGGDNGSGYDENVIIHESGLWSYTPDSPTPPSPNPAPTPKQPVIIENGVTAPPFPLGRGQYFGPEAGGANSISGYHSHKSDLALWQQRMAHRGWKIATDGRYGNPGNLTPRGETASVALAAQVGWRLLPFDSLIGPATWAAAWSRNITRP